MFSQKCSNYRKKTGINIDDQHDTEQKQSKDIIWIGIGILIIVLIEISTREGFFSTRMNRLLQMLEKTFYKT